MASKYVIRKISREKITKVKDHAQMLFDACQRKKRVKKITSQEEYEALAFQEAISALVLEFAEAIEKGK